MGTRQQKIKVEDIIRNTLLILEQQGYKIHNTRKYNTVYRGLAQFSHSNFSGEYSQKVGESFIQSLRERKPPLSDEFFRTYCVAIERANHVMEGETNWHPQKKLHNYADSAYRAEVVLYEEYLRNSGKTKSDICARVHVVARFLRYLDSIGIKKLGSLTPQSIYAAFGEARDKNGFHKCVRAFLRYAHKHALTKEDFSILVPSASRHIPVPSVYSPEEVEKIIQTAKSSNLCGKRNYAIVLIAARLGLRSCDIANLRFENLYSNKKTIEITQLKTKEPLILPLTPEILASIDDYSANERPDCDSGHIFVKATQPIGEPLQGYTIYTIVSRIVDKSGVDVKGRKRGAHALRASLATALLDEGNSHTAIRQALGQKSPQALKSYAKTDVKHLREYALPVSKPSGYFAKRLGVDA